MNRPLQNGVHPGRVGLHGAQGAFAALLNAVMIRGWKMSPEWRTRTALFGLWTLLGLFFGMKYYFDAAPFGGNLRLTKALWWHLMEWYAWAVCSPAVFWICRKYHRWPWPRYLFVHLGAALTLSTVQVGLCSIGAVIEAWCYNWPRTQVGDPFSWRTVFEFSLINHIHFNVFTYCLIVGAWHLAHYYRQSRVRELKAAELQASLNRAQLEMLRTQLQPHFLFNTLNSIAELIYQDPETAERMVMCLSDLLRLTLKQGAAQEVSLNQEIETLQRYLDIERARFGDRLRVVLELAPETLYARVPHFVLQPLVENAIRHGVARRKGPGEIRIRSRREDESLLLTVEDDGPGLSDRPSDGHGIGLANTKARLRHLYGERQCVDLTSEDGLAVSIQVPFAASASVI